MKPVLGTDPNFLTMLVEINHDITSTLDLDRLLKKIAALTNRITPYQIFAIFLVDEARHDLYYRFGIGHERRSLKLCASTSEKDSSVLRPSSRERWSWTTCEPIPDTSKSSRKHDRSWRSL